MLNFMSYDVYAHSNTFVNTVIENVKTQLKPILAPLEATITSTYSLDKQVQEETDVNNVCWLTWNVVR